MTAPTHQFGPARPREEDHSPPPPSDVATDAGRVGCAETGSHASHEARADLRPTGFDPARGLKRQLLVHIGRRCLREHAGADCNDEIVGMLRSAAKHVTGGNCSFADDDLNVLEHLALRAVEAGLTDGLHPNVAHRAASARRAETQGEGANGGLPEIAAHARFCASATRQGDAPEHSS